jgi:perosamine synthetase
MEVKDLAIQNLADLREALLKLDSSGLGILFVVNNNQKLLGVLTDGDIRRAMIGGAQMEFSVEKVMNTNFVSLPIETDNIQILHCITEKVKVIPLVDNKNILVDFASINKITRISVASPNLDGNELAYVTDCIKTNWISSQGQYVRKFENLFTEYHEQRASLAVSNGTVALHLALVALGIGEGDEVIVPDLTFAASVNAIIYTGATPVLVDVEHDTWNINIEKAEKLITAKTRAIMPVHLFGHPCDMKAINILAVKHELLIIEDCAEALGSLYQGRPVGVFGDVATFSFFGNKTITTGEGGMVVFKDLKIAEYASVLRDHGMEKTRRYWHAHVGYNYRLTNIQAAIGVAQYERLAEFVSAKRKIAATYNNCISKINFLTIPAERKDCVNSYWLYTFLVNEDAPFSRDNLIEYLSLCGVESRPVFFPIHEMPPYESFGNKSQLLVSSYISSSGISLPSASSLTNEEQLFVCNCIEKFTNINRTTK